MALLMATAMAFATAGTIRVARHRVYGAADLTALEAGRLALADPEHACARAEAVSSANGVRLVRCTLTNEVANVWTSLEITLPALGKYELTGQARAGPSWIPASPNTTDTPP